MLTESYFGGMGFPSALVYEFLISWVGIVCDDDSPENEANIKKKLPFPESTSYMIVSRFDPNLDG